MEAGIRDRQGLISWTNHDARAAAPVERDHDGVTGSRARQCAGPTARSCGFTNELAPSRMKAVSYIRAANESLKRSSDLRTLASLAII